jgi:hypothetical protein
VDHFLNFSGFMPGDTGNDNIVFSFWWFIAVLLSQPANEGGGEGLSTK